MHYIQYEPTHFRRLTKLTNSRTTARFDHSEIFIGGGARKRKRQPVPTFLDKTIPSHQNTDCQSLDDCKMGKAKKTRKFAVTKKIISPKDTRVKENLEKAKKKAADKKKKEEPRQIEQAVSSLFFQYNTQLGPPYHVLVDTNFINFSIR